MSNYTALIGRDKQSFTQTRPEFFDTYWIIPEYETTPYGKVSFTRQDRRTFIALFKDSRLIWAGRQPVNCFTENVKRTESQKQDVKRSVNPTSSVKETESCRGQSVSDIVTQGGVKITPPSAITNIVTVQGVAHV